MHPSKARVYVFSWSIFAMALGILASLYFHISTHNNIADRDKEHRDTDRNNIRPMFAYEISYNQSNLRLLEGTKNAGFEKEKCQAEICTASPVELNVFAGIRLMILNSLRDDVYT
ncbi:hypothetical protein KWH41_24390, partial [Escherichia coli]|nr:hypothetical protein [Escherichia coli]